MGMLKLKLGAILKRVGLGVADAVIPNIKKNIESIGGGEGKIDWLRLSVAVCTIIAVVAWLMGKVSLSDLGDLFKMLN